MGERINKTIQIADTIHGSVRLNFIEKQVISTQMFNRLHNISQNSTAYLTFPTNRTKRFEHSIGTMKLCGNMFMSSIANSDEETLKKFFKSVEEVIDKQINSTKLEEKYNDYRGKIGDRNFDEDKIKEYKNIEINDEYNNVIPININSEHRSLYVILFQAVRLAALMHDAGHPPFSHITEFALKDVWNELNYINENDRTDRQKKYLSIMEGYFKSNQDLHEQIGNKITAKVMKSIIISINEEEAKEQDLFEQQLFKVIVSEITLAILDEKATVFSDIHRIIDGTIDGDRMDYVSRDPINSGLNVGCIEYDRIIESMRLVEEGENFLFAPSTKSIDSIEDFFNRRWKLYKQIVYHHRVIKTDFLLQDCIKELAKLYLVEDISEPKEDSRILDYNISSIWKAIENKTSRSYFFDKLIQWDDGWLMAILKKHYFDKYSGDTKSCIAYKLDELLANNKHYYSVIKRMEDFLSIDNAVAESVKNGYSKINMLIEENEKTSEKEGLEKVTVELNKLFKYVSELEVILDKYIDSDSPVPSDGFILRKIDKIYVNMFSDGWLSEIIEKCVKEIKEDSKYNIKDAFVIIKKVKVGINGGRNAKQGGLGVYTTSNRKLEVKNFLDLSNVGKNIGREINFMPAFYLYIYKNNHNDFKDYDTIKNDLGTMIGKEIILKVEEKLSQLIKN